MRLSRVIFVLLIGLTVALCLFASPVQAEYADVDEEFDDIGFDDVEEGGYEEEAHTKGENDDEEEVYAEEEVEDDADEDELEVEIGDDEEILLPSPYAKVSHVFENVPEGEFIVNRRVDLLIMFANEGMEKFNITRIHASMALLMGGDTYQNFSDVELGMIVAPGSEYTIYYPFRPDDRFMVETCRFVATVEYQGAYSNYLSTIVNTTIQIVDDPTPFDAQTFFGWLAAIAVTALVGLLFQQWLKKDDTTKRTSKSSMERGTVKEGALAGVDYGNLDPSMVVLPSSKSQARSPKLRGKSSRKKKK